MRMRILFLAPALSLVPHFVQAETAVPAKTELPTVATVESKATARAAVADYGKVPLSFEVNQGQSDALVKFQSRGSGYSLFLTDSAAVLTLAKADPRSGNLDHKAPTVKSGAPKAVKTDVVRMELAGASPSAPVGAEALPGTANYFIGNDPSKWHSHVPTYAKVKYPGVYPGIDLVYYGNQRQLEYDFVIAPGADAKPVRLTFAGARRLTLTPGGDLAVSANHGEIMFRKPVVYQTVDGQRRPIEGRFTLVSRNTVGFRLGRYDHSSELVIDPVLAYSTYLENATINAIAVDALGHAYLTGSAGPGFAITSGAYQTSPSSGSPNVQNDAFITKLGLPGTGLIYSTYLGGKITPPGAGNSNGQTGWGIAVDSTGHAYVTGVTYSQDFPVTPGAFQALSKATISTAGSSMSYLTATTFVTKLSADGTALVYSTYLGGSGGPLCVGCAYRAGDFAISIAVDNSNDAYVTGYTYSTDFPLSKGSYMQANTAHPCGYVTKLNTTGSALDYSTYLCGSYSDGPDSIAVDSSGSAYLTGVTYSKDFPTTQGSLEPILPEPSGGAGGNPNALTGSVGFVTKLNPTGSVLAYSTFLGLAADDYGEESGVYANGIAVDKTGSAYVAGTTGYLQNFPTTPGALQTSSTGHYLGFVSKLNPDGNALVYSTYLGGHPHPEDSGYVAIRSVALNALGDAFVTGGLEDNGFPITSDALQSTNQGTNETGFFSKLNSTGSALLYSTYLGGSVFDQGVAIAVDPSGNAYIAGYSDSPDFPISPDAFQRSNPAAGGFIAKFAFSGITTTTLTADMNPQPSGSPVILTAVVAAAEGTAIPTGQMSFMIDGHHNPLVDLDDSGRAIFSADNLAAGSHTVVATYLGDKTFSTSYGTLTETITGQ